MRDSDATLILRQLVLTESPRDPGTTWTFESAIIHGKPVLLCDPTLPSHQHSDLVAQWIQSLAIKTLNIAGPAESTQPGIGQAAEAFLLRVFRQLSTIVEADGSRP